MSQYRKKPVVIEAVQRRRGKNEDEIKAFIGDAYTVSPDHLGQVGIHTLEGTMWADDGDWIIRGVAREVYPCKPAIFEATYEAVSPGNPGGRS
jgi:hypothetical protein